MAPITALPTEILQQIWSLIQKDDILNLAGACSAIRNVGESFRKKHMERLERYSAFRKMTELEDNRSNYGEHSVNLFPPPALLSLLRDICNEPVTAEYIKDIVIDSCNVSWNGSISDRRHLWTNECEHVFASIMENCPYLSYHNAAGGMTAEANRCIQSIERGNEDVPIGLLLSLLPKARTLRFCLTDFIPTFCAQMISHIACDSTANALSQLTTVTIDFSHGTYTPQQPLALLIMFATLPSMDSLRAFNIGAASHPYVTNVSEKSSKVTEISLRRTVIYHTSLHAYHVMYKALKKFTYESFDPQNPGAWYNPKMIINELLRSAKDSLTHLTLHSHASTRTWMDSLHIMGSLDIFPALTHLHTDWHSLVDDRNASAQQLVAHLPPTIQELHLKVNSDFNVHANTIDIQNLVLAVPSRFPGLTDLRLRQLGGEKSKVLMRKQFVKTEAGRRWRIGYFIMMGADPKFKWCE